MTLEVNQPTKSGPPGFGARKLSGANASASVIMDAYGPRSAILAYYEQLKPLVDGNDTRVVSCELGPDKQKTNETGIEHAVGKFDVYVRSLAEGQAVLRDLPRMRDQIFAKASEPTRTALGQVVITSAHVRCD
jgi:hypothetical protein